MKKLLSILLFLLSINSYATTYYVAANGNDVNNGTSTTTPFKTITKVNSLSLIAGDVVRFNGGDTFYGALVISHSGSSGNPITYNSYGTGNAIITGFTNVSSWTNLGSNIWESSSAISTLPACNMVVINGVNAPMGRYPNTGYLTYQSFTSTSITSSSLNSSVTNWSGATAVIRKNNYVTDKSLITSASGSTLNYANTGTSPCSSCGGYGFFIQNDARTLDVQNEWYYNPSTKKLRIYSTTSPTNVQVPTIDTLVYINGRNYISFSNLSFTGSNTQTFLFSTSANITVSNCQFNFSGYNCILQNGASSNRPIIQNCSINNTGNNALFLGAGSTNGYIGTDTVLNTAIIPGTGGSGSDQYSAIRTNSSDTVEYCYVVNSGHHGIYFSSSNSIIRNNFINNFGITKTDVGGIYTYFGTPVARSNRTNQQVYNNIILNGVSSIAGTTMSVPLAHGIYLDGLTSNVDVYNNTIFNNAYSGLFINSGDSAINAHDNTIYNNGLDQLLVYSTITAFPNRLLTVKNNKCISRLATQKASSWNNIQNNNDILNFGTAASIDSNYLARPIDDNLTIETSINSFFTVTQRNLAQWQTYSGFDAHSNKSPVTISNVNQLFFAYNPNSYDSAITIPSGTWEDVTGTSYATSTTLHAYSSIVLISTGSLITPTITWSNQTVAYGTTLSTSNVYSATANVAGTFSYNISGMPNAGIYSNFTVTFTPTDGATYSTVTKTVTLAVTQFLATISVTNTTQTWTGLPLAPIVTTVPAGLPYSILYNGVAATPTEPNSYSYIANIISPNYTATAATGTFTINKATTTFVVTDTSIFYDGNSHLPTVATIPANLTGVTINSAHTAIASYLDTINISNAHYQAAQKIVNFTISASSASIIITDTLQTYNGFPKPVTIITNPLGLVVTTTYNGSPTAPTNAGTYTVISFISDGIHTGADTATLTISKGNYELTYTTPAPIQQGSALTSTQENATSTIAGTFSYNYPIGYVVQNNITIIAIFTPTDTANYNSQSASVLLSVYGSPINKHFVKRGKLYPVNQ